ncbi:HpcH/HpaI aldolase/citrate lyase family protein [Afifella sp. IM 167]|uniref:HpcH/HpaI aldolase family protein n=1 Tax=Afifella sp. IM 167 TaxID=2033586 RepID=UPI001CCAE4E2|nr:aldolase/citrate lyase family protein [Afifella sp. IM 167]MBZ8134690.1 2,4-dihydroxyhept-2-ene-1,7-dioic acid aldolase [Afifella sp. IM 167]
MAAAPTLAERLRAGEKLVSAWSGLTDPMISEMLGRSGFDAVTLDMQHGFHSTESVQRCIGGIALSGRPAIVRVPVGRFDMASRALDMGAEAVIAPMVNSLADARAFAAAMKFPPIGQRSWGPGRAIELSGASESGAYLSSANRGTLSFAMIETREALALLDDILAVDGIDGVFVGPADFSIAWSGGADVDPTLEDMMGAIESIAVRAQKSGKLSAVFAADPSFGRRYHEMGFNLVATAPDTACLAAGAATFLALAKK